MSSTADLVLKNIKWRVESIDPTDSTTLRNFRWVDAESVDPEDVPLVRTFWAEWTGQSSDSEIGVTDLSERVAVHTFVIHVLYPYEYPLEKRMDIMLKDRHDIIKALRDPSGFSGYSDSSPSSNIGLWSRTVKSVDISEEYENTSTLRFNIECTILESE